jgi:RNA polymerase sigma factor (sigma-70 family)
MYNKSIEECLADNSIISIMRTVEGRYKNSIDVDDLSSVSYETLWRCIDKFDTSRNAKFTSYLYQQLNFAFKNQLKRDSKNKSFATDNIEKCFSETVKMEAMDIINSMPDDLGTVLRQRFIDNMTIQEIGNANGYSRETARRRIKKAFKVCKNFN